MEFNEEALMLTVSILDVSMASNYIPSLHKQYSREDLRLALIKQTIPYVALVEKFSRNSTACYRAVFWLGFCGLSVQILPESNLLFILLGTIK
uniref:Uncharacterized protein n=1 Tax=Octopus bimaculoides TaxID=37653 RepID=A0A0L8HCH4_OCTBM